MTSLGESKPPAEVRVGKQRVSFGTMNTNAAGSERRVIYSMNVSLDGFVETTDRGLDWVIIDEELHTFFNDQARETGAFVYGRRMYEFMVDYWPTADANPSAPEYEVDFARIWKACPRSCSRRPSSTSNGIPGWSGATSPKRSRS